MHGIYYGKSSGMPLGPYHEDEINAQLRAKDFLKSASHDPITQGAEVYRVEADSPWDARSKIDTHLKQEKKR